MVNWWRRIQSPQPRLFKPRVEVLEDRRLLAVDAILEWNAITLEANRIDHSPTLGGRFEQPGPTRTARAFAIVHGAMYDAFNAIDRSAETYLVPVSNSLSANASIDAAVATAAFRTLRALYPSQSTRFELAFRRSLGHVPDGQAENRGVALGEFVANEYLRMRQNDGSQIREPYVPIGNVPGAFQTFAGEPAALDPNWGNVVPFGLLSGSQFRAPPPPALTSAAYAAAYNEVRVLGAVDAETADRDGDRRPDRTPEQTRIGIYWGYDGTPGLGTPPRLYNQIARTIALQEDNTEAENARLFALVNLAMADAGIASWETKYFYDIWRPIRGIRQVGSNGQTLDDGNPRTTAERNWLPLGAPAVFGGTDFTPPFPAYTSGHATFGAALFEILRQFYGRNNLSFTFMSDEFSGTIQGSSGVVRPLLTRTFRSFTQAELENAQSRIYLGIHWGFDRDAGIAQGRAVADFLFENYLVPRDPRGRSRERPPSLMAPDTAWALTAPGGFRLLTRTAGNEVVEHVATELAPAVDPSEDPSASPGQAPAVHPGRSQAALQRREAELRDAVFGAGDLTERLGELS
jgi:hypothetical protein